jgi:hypothetical protein
MKLPAVKLTTEQKLREFDVWITPSLGDIRETPQFKNTLAAIVRAFDRLCQATNDFASEAELNHGHLADNLVKQFASQDREEVLRILTDLASVLFLVTGKSDNNAKCQFPLFLKNVLHRDTLPRGKTTRRKGVETHQVTQEEPPRTIDTKKYMRWVVGLHHSPAHQRELIDIFLRFVLNEDDYLAQLWGLGRSYAMLKPLGRSQALLSPLVVILVRGSVAATGGHEPEKILRQLMLEWGLAEEMDFNSGDVKLNDELRIAKEVDTGAGEKVKTRAYDFALPYKVPSWGRKVLIQSQYYAGDSGSVSHKNVDQTTAARQEAKKTVGLDVCFVEYVDGAGFFASLNGDLESLLAMPDTASFIQLRSTPIRLRRELQHIGFLTPIEIEHAIFSAGTKRKAVVAALLKEGYQPSEIDRAIGEAISRGVLVRVDSKNIAIDPARRAQARRYLLLDLTAIRGATLSQEERSQAGYVLVPGYGPFHGMKAADLLVAARTHAPSLKQDWPDAVAFKADLNWLAERGYMIVNEVP